jgi:hypothetical protein
MAKELPYFKFEPNQWENGNIQMLPRNDKGLFIDLCSMYWSRLGDLPIKLAIQKLCSGNATALDSLCNEKIIEVIEGNIYIKFLSEQLEDFKDISDKNSRNAKEGWEKRRNKSIKSDINATASKSQSENDGIREEKRREEEIKEEKKRENKNALLPVFNFKNSFIDLGVEKQILEDWLVVRKLKKSSNTQTSFESFVSEVKKTNLSINEAVRICASNSWSGFKKSWIEDKNEIKETKQESKLATWGMSNLINKNL